MKIKTKESSASLKEKREDIPQWKPEQEVQLFYALNGRRPVGKY